MKNVYQLLLDEHFKNPRNNKVLLNPHIHLTNVNPLCGDSISIQMIYEADQVVGIGIQAQGCVISVATASLLSEIVLKKQCDHILSFDSKTVCTLIGTELGPTRLKCALMGLKAIHQSIHEWKKKYDS